MTEHYTIKLVGPGRYALRKIDPALGHEAGPTRIVYTDEQGRLWCDPTTCEGAKYMSGRRPHTKHVEAVTEWLAKQQKQEDEHADNQDDLPAAD